MPKWFIYISLAFMLYVISANPQHTGNLANGFFGAAGDLVENTGQFFNGIVEGENADNTPNPVPEVPAEQGDPS